MFLAKMSNLHVGKIEIAILAVLVMRMVAMRQMHNFQGMVDDMHSMFSSTEVKEPEREDDDEEIS